MANKTVIFLSLLILSTGIASADIFNFDYHSVDLKSVSVSGTITATADGGGVYSITGITGTRNGLAFTFIHDPSPSLFAVDNKLIVPASPAYLSATLSSGFVIQDATGQYNPWYDFNNSFGGQTGKYYEYNGNYSTIPGTEIVFNVSVPEPTALSLLVTMLAGVAGLSALLRKREA